MRLADLELRIKVAQIDEFIARVDPAGTIRKLQQDLRALTTQQNELRSAYQGVVACVEARLGVKMADHDYDDVTGELIIRSTPPPAEG
jgi:hypothetical protein